ncbi:MAG: D-aminoacyl-tRNA deacylase [Anaerolineaceae bacterium]
MKALLQRVSSGSVSVEGNTIASIGIGLVILVGIGRADGEPQAQAMAEKIATLRIFEDEAGKMNLSIRDTNGAALVVSQFTLYADTRKGRRPAFIDAAAPDVAKKLVDVFIKTLQDQGIPTQSGEFGAHMSVEITNDGPVTIMIEL